MVLASSRTLPPFRVCDKGVLRVVEQQGPSLLAVLTEGGAGAGERIPPVDGGAVDEAGGG